MKHAKKESRNLTQLQLLPPDRKMIAQEIFSILDDPSIGEIARKIGFEDGFKRRSRAHFFIFKKKIFEGV